MMATEKRLIDANKIYDLVERRYQVSSGIEHRCERDFLDLICEAETVDAVEVIRCKNCINGIYDEVNDRYKCVKSAEYDPEFGDWLGFVSYCNADYYCADGERKDND